MVYLTVHFTAVGIYAFPVKTENKLKPYVFPYVYPYFHQDWSMFVPVPKENFNVYVKHDFGNWEDLFYEVNSAHQRNRLAGNEALLFSISNGLRYYAASVGDKTTMEKEDGSNVNFSVLKKIIVNYLTLKNKQAPKNLEVVIRIKDMGNGSDHSHYYKVNV